MNETLLENAQTVLEEMLSRLGAVADVSAAPDTAEPKLLLSSSQAGRLIGRKGQNLESLELVMNRILRRHQLQEDTMPWVTLEVDGYSVPRRTPERHGRLAKDEIQHLEALALDIAKEVKYWGESKVIGPFRPAERRIIHLSLRNDPSVETISDSEADADGYKCITVRPISDGDAPAERQEEEA